MAALISTITNTPNDLNMTHPHIQQNFHRILVNNWNNPAVRPCICPLPSAVWQTCCCAPPASSDGRATRTETPRTCESYSCRENTQRVSVLDECWMCFRHKDSECPWTFVEIPPDASDVPDRVWFFTNLVFRLNFFGFSFLFHFFFWVLFTKGLITF